MYVDKLLMLDRIPQRITVKQAKIHHAHTAISLITSWTIGKIEVVWFYYGALVFTKLPKGRHKMKSNEEKLMQATTEKF